MGGKTATSTQNLQVPASVLAQYQSVNSKADATASQPFQSYNGEFVAPTNATQNAGIAGTNAAANEAQPYFDAATGTLGGAQAGVNPINQAATGLAAGSAQAVNPSDLDAASIQKYMSPYVQDVAGSTAALLNQNNQQQQAGQLGNAITSGAFGGDRTGIAAANLEQQQNLSNASTYANILNTGYTNAQSVAQQQQGVGLAAGQANRAALGSAAQTLSGIGATQYGEGANTATTLAGLGSGAQSAALQGSQAQIAAGTVQQQTQQAQDTAEYNQFLQQESYPFQVDSFLAQIAEGTGALSGSTTTTQQPGGFFSDERLKEDMEPIGRTFDGQPIYRYKMKGDDRDRIGLSAQKVEKTHPEAVGVAGGFRYVDYGKATEEAANRGHFHEGGVVPFRRAAYAGGGGPDDSDGGLGAVLAAQRNMYASGQGGAQRNIQAPSASHQLAVASGTPAPPPSGSSHVSQAVGLGKDAYKGYQWATQPSGPSASAVNGIQGSSADYVNSNLAAQPIDTGLGAANTAAPAASDAAATGAGDAAAAGAGDAAAGAGADAAAGAATGAVAGGAADAAATEAAALAAEYAAADAAVALVAAKKGGRIKYASGGSPYAETDGDLDIPDDQTSVHLQTAGPLQKQPTGLQTAMKMGDPNQASGIAGSIFSNQGLASGGVARRGYDDGGTPTDDDVTPDVSSYGPPVEDADTSGVAASSDKPSLWDKVKKHATADNVIPILQGLAAMGTAKTRSPGVALAAGLGAGSQSYLDTRKSLAETEREQARAQGLEIANRMSNLKLGVAKDALAPASTGVPRQTTPATQSPTTNPTSAPSAAQTATGLDAQYRNQFFVNPARTPEEQATKDAAVKKDWAVGGTMFQTQADNDYEARVKRDQANARNTAQQLADARYAQFNGATNPADKQVALAHYNALRQWTGDETAIEGGIVKNGRTKQPEIGTIAQQGFTPADESRFMEMALAPMDVRNPADGSITQVEAWKGHGAASPQAYAQSLKVNSTAPKAASVSAPASRVSAQPAPASAGPAVPAGVIGASQSPVAARQQALDQEAVAHVREAGDAAPQNRNINQQLLQLSEATKTGPLTATLQKLAAAAQLPSGSRYQEINAYLDRQAATQAAAMGVPHTNAGLAASQMATGTTEYTPQALQEKVKFADALNTGAMAYRQGLDKAVGTGATPNLRNYQKFRSAWSQNFDPDIFRADDAIRRGDKAELDAIRSRLGPRGMKMLAQKNANLQLLESGQIPP